ncbi:MAG: hypothetical protein WBO73_19635, partial [Gammaproteobacteria bacterium]
SILAKNRDSPQWAAACLSSNVHECPLPERVPFVDRANDITVMAPSMLSPYWAASSSDNLKRIIARYFNYCHRWRPHPSLERDAPE